MSVCSNQACGADVTGQQWCLVCGTQVAQAASPKVPTSETISEATPPRARRTVLLTSAAAVGVVALAGGFTFLLAGTGAEAEPIDSDIGTPTVLTRDEGQANEPVDPPKPITPPQPVTTPAPPVGQSWEAVTGRSDLLKTPVTSDEMANAVVARYVAGQIAPEGTWITSPANGKQYLIRCSEPQNPPTQHTACLEVDNEDGGELDAGIVVLK
jgi:hypothetical protein